MRENFKGNKRRREEAKKKKKEEKIQKKLNRGSDGMPGMPQEAGLPEEPNPTAT
jgi:hypothetical protein